jgi:hypothetical protein
VRRHEQTFPSVRVCLVATRSHAARLTKAQRIARLFVADQSERAQRWP